MYEMAYKMFLDITLNLGQFLAEHHLRPITNFIPLKQEGMSRMSAAGMFAL